MKYFSSLGVFSTSLFQEAQVVLYQQAKLTSKTYPINYQFITSVLMFR
jgi:hypothetical protein